MGPPPRPPSLPPQVCLSWILEVTLGLKECGARERRACGPSGGVHSWGELKLERAATFPAIQSACLFSQGFFW